MWKKVGTVGPTSTQDNKSNRSRDQNPIEQPFSQMTKQRMSESQIFFEPNDYFFSNYLNKIKDPDCLKHTSQQSTRFNKLTHARSHKQLPTEYSQADTKRKTLNLNQFQQLSNRFNQDNFETPLKKKQSLPIEENIKTLQSTQKIESSTSIENNVKTLKQCRSTPQLNLSQFRAITEEVTLHKKIQTKKNLEMLKKQHSEIKKAVQSELSQFSNQFNSMQAEMSQQINKMIESKTQKNKSAKDKKQITKNQNIKQFKADEIIPEAKKFSDKLKTLNQKKVELIQKYKSFRVK